jgi:anti-sigma regulatory factor (Ser/Thr protein kinase)
MMTLACSFAADAGELATLRAALRSYLEARGVPSPVRDDLGVVVTELAANAIEAGRNRGAVGMRARVDGDLVILEVEDGGAGFQLPPAPALPSPHDERGRGLWLVRSLTNELRVERHQHVTVVRAVRRFRGTAEEAGTGTDLRSPGEARAAP